jgi:hypothetical protein
MCHCREKRCFGARADPLWDSSADVNGDGKINTMDIGTVARNFGEHYT